MYNIFLKNIVINIIQKLIKIYRIKIYKIIKNKKYY